MSKCFDPFPRTENIKVSKELEEEKEGHFLNDLKEAMELLEYAMKTADSGDWAPYKDKNVLLASTACLNAGQTINTAYYIQYAGSLIGKELKILMQVMPWACRPLSDDGLMKEEIWELWRVLGSFTSRLWVPGIPQDKIESYISYSRKYNDVAVLEVAMGHD
ncbi:hypothetical protein BT69DRAFT_1296624 [Atractiella rhizophila]|nr:hypothetical protein BT69DRAFT_1296624 [Atractiella rhizophila]